VEALGAHSNESSRRRVRGCVGKGTDVDLTSEAITDRFETLNDEERKIKP